MDDTLKLTKTVQFGSYEAEVVHGAFPAQRFHGAFVEILKGQLSTGFFERDTTPLLAFVESWTAPGDCHDLEAWKALDWITEYGALRRAILDIVNEHLEKVGGDLPNSASAPTSS
jgi:hypothetical protein